MSQSNENPRKHLENQAFTSAVVGGGLSAISLPGLIMTISYLKKYGFDDRGTPPFAFSATFGTIGTIALFVALGLFLASRRYPQDENKEGNLIINEQPTSSSDNNCCS